MELASDPALDRLLLELRDRQSKSKAPKLSGIVTLLDDTEAHALEGLTGPPGKRRRLKAGSKIKIEEIDQLLQKKSLFKGGLRELLEVRFGPWVSRSGKPGQREREERATFTRLINVACECAPGDLRDELFGWIDKTAPFYMVVRPPTASSPSNRMSERSSEH